MDGQSRGLPIAVCEVHVAYNAGVVGASGWREIRIGLIQAFTVMLPSVRFADSSPQRGEPDMATKLAEQDVGFGVEADAGARIGDVVLVRRPPSARRA